MHVAPEDAAITGIQRGRAESFRFSMGPQLEAKVVMEGRSHDCFRRGTTSLFARRLRYRKSDQLVSRPTLRR